MKLCARGEAGGAICKRQVDSLVAAISVLVVRYETVARGMASTNLSRYLSLDRLSFLHASCRTSVRYVLGVTLTVARRMSAVKTTTCDDIVVL